MTMTPEEVASVPLPAGSLISKSFDTVDYADAFAIALPPDATTTVDAFMRRFLTSRPSFFRVPMR